MGATYKLKTQDGKASELIIKKWRYGYITTDERIEGMAERNERIRKRNSEKYAGDPNPFTPTPGKAKLQVYFNPKAAEKLPPIIKEILPKWPTAIVFKNVYYNIVDKKMFINFFSDAKLQEE